MYRFVRPVIDSLIQHLLISSPSPSQIHMDIACPTSFMKHMIIARSQFISNFIGIRYISPQRAPWAPLRCMHIGIHLWDETSLSACRWMMSLAKLCANQHLRTLTCIATPDKIHRSRWICVCALSARFLWGVILSCSRIPSEGKIGSIGKLQNK